MQRQFWDNVCVKVLEQLEVWNLKPQNGTACVKTMTLIKSRLSNGKIKKKWKMVQHAEKQSTWTVYCCNVLGKIMSQIYCLKHASFFSCFFYLFTSIPSSPFFHRSTPQPHPPLIRRWHHSCSNFLYYTSPHCRTTVIYRDTQTHPFMCNYFR